MKRCNYSNSLTDNKKGDISVALCTLAPIIDERCSNIPIGATKKPRLDSRP